MADIMRKPCNVIDMKNVMATAAFALSINAATANAQTVQIGQDHAPSNSTFLAGYRASASNGPLAGVWITEFFRTNEQPYRFLARRALAATAGEEQVQVIDERECPALASVLESLNGLPMPTVRVRNLSRQDSFGPFFPSPTTQRTEAASYTIWASATQSDGSFADLRVSGTEGQIGGWGRFADQLLFRCWSSVTQ
ncbi:hypothetical protein [Brevundimonas goettingensis]|uniref:Uncharacterized protein n=1 Tax=Brevundimonas goettingensis TaxID=2774190 RepID=A0A975C3H7_9CAUL|nr:hypothetical protein [Brevundimonas goettingensis]QTC92810.1 hypothetical protein IFJ75_08180 [Brevundimonas goettingensis]